MPEYLRPLVDPSSLFMLAGVLFYFWKGDRLDALWLSSFWVFMVVISVVQAWRGDRSVRALMDFLHPWVRVLREGREQWCRSEQVAPGTLVRLDEGERVPLDVEVLTARNLGVDESFLSGESAMQERFEGDELQAGSLLIKGSATGRVLRSWSEGRWQGIRKVVAGSRRPPSKLTLSIRRWTRRASVFALVLGGLLAWKGGSALLGISVALAFLPNELPAILALFTSMAAVRMARGRVLVRDLSSAEELGRLTLLALDKTGTLTTHGIRWVSAEVPRGGPPSRPPSRSSIARVCWHSGAFDPGTDPIDRALQSRLEQASGEWPAGVHIREYPMQRGLRVIAHCFRFDGLEYFAKGAPEDVAQWVRRDEGAELLAATAGLASKGYRVLALAWGDRLRDGRSLLEPVEQAPSVEWRLCGWIAFEDPLRPESKGFVGQLHRMGVHLRLITGDHPETAQAVGRALGFGPGDQVLWRITPIEKKEHIDRWMSEGHRVGMVGDGVNDAPALKASHVGIAMARQGTDVAREAASVLLLEDDLFDLGSAMRIARGLSTQLHSVLVFLLAAHIPLVIFTLLPLFVPRSEHSWLGPVQIAFLHLAIEPVAALAFPLTPRESPVEDRIPWRTSVFWGVSVGVLELMFFRLVDDRTGVLALLLSGTLVLLLVLVPHSAAADRRLAPIIGAILLGWFLIAGKMGDAGPSRGSLSVSLIVLGSVLLGYLLRRWRRGAKPGADAGSIKDAMPVRREGRPQGEGPGLVTGGGIDKADPKRVEPKRR